MEFITHNEAPFGVSFLLEGCTLIVFDESEYLESDFTDLTLSWIQELYGPAVKDMLLTRTVVINVPPSHES